MAALVAVPAGTASAPAFQQFRSRPDLRPPGIRLLQAPHDATPGYIFLAPKRDAVQAGPMILDERGQLVWFLPLDTRGVTDLRLQHYRGRPVLTWWHARPSWAKTGTPAYTVVDASYRTVAVIRPLGGPTADPHELILTSRGTALLTTFRTIGFGGRQVIDGGVQELDLRTGRVLLDWRATHHVALSESYSRPPRLRSTNYDYFHVNSIDIDTDGNLLVSARNTHTVYKIKRRTGAVIWRLGGKRSDFKLGRGVRFAWQHDARRQGDGTISIFDNGAAPQVHRQSRVIFVRLDTRRKTATLVRYVVHRPPRLAINQGNAQLLPRRHVLVNWGRQPYVTEFDGNGRVVFDLTFGRSTDSYRAFRFGWVGHPLTKPAVAVSGRRLYVSWNGATEVSHWQILAGPTRRDLRPFLTVRKRGFETSAPAPPAPWLVVRAVDRSGRTLGWSRVIRTD